jgi:hypothetical protein
MPELSSDESSYCGRRSRSSQARGRGSRGARCPDFTMASAPAPIARRPDGRRARLTADASIRGRNSNACGAEAAPLGWWPKCRDDAPLPSVLRSPAGDGALSIAVQPAPNLSAIGYRPVTHSFRRRYDRTRRRHRSYSRPRDGRIKAAMCGAGREKKERAKISALPRCAVLSRDVRNREIGTKSAPIAHCADCHPHDRKASRPRVLLGHSLWRWGGSQ